MQETEIVMSEDIKILPVETLHSFMRDVFIGVGVPEEDARVSADVLIASDLRGIESHGVGRLKMYYDRIRRGQHQAVTQLEVVRESPTTALVDGHHGMGMVIGVRSMQMAIDKARQYGMGSVAVRNSTHFGIDGYYVNMAIQAGMLGMAFTNARPSIAPTFGVEPMLGTNPIAFGAPTDEECPFLFDGATAIAQRGKFEVAARVNKSVPEGWVIDQQGEYITDPHQVLRDLTVGEAALVALGGKGEQLGGHKGYGLAVMVEILSASLQSGSFLYGLTGVGEQGQHRPYRLGHFFMAINIESFTPLEDFKATTGAILRDLRSSNKAPGHERIYTAGEKEFDNERRIRQEGVPIVPVLQEEIKTMQRELGLTQYEFPF
jgi:LDH2 family malate/lactate/ureidoglycolate dehydrogenase